MQYILVTGVSTGIGYAIAELFVKKGYGVLGSVRKERDAAALQAKWGEQFVPLIFDVTDEAAVHEAIPVVESALGGMPLLAIVNNAGIAVPGPLVYLDSGAFRKQFEVNVFGVLYVTQAFWPFLKGTSTDKAGKIINMSSVSGIITTPFLGAYCGSKMALEAMTDALRRELVIHDIDVLAIQPGPIKTPIWQKTATQQDPSLYVGTEYEEPLKRMEKGVQKSEERALPVSEVAELAFRMVTKPYRKTRKVISANKWLTILASWLPARWLDSVMVKQLLKKRM